MVFTNKEISKKILISYILFFSFLCCHKEYSFEVPIHKDAYQIEKFSNVKGIICVKYKVKVPYHSNQVLKYYDEKLKEKGWIPFIEDYYVKDDRNWQSVGKEESWLTAYWVDLKKTKRITLMLKHYLKKSDTYSSSDNNSKIEQIVLYEERPYYELPPPFLR